MNTGLVNDWYTTEIKMGINIFVIKINKRMIIDLKAI